MDSDFQLIKVGKGINLLHDQFLFTINKRRESGVYFTCKKNGCRAKLKTDFEMTEILNFSEEHNHLPPDHEIENLKYSPHTI